MTANYQEFLEGKRIAQVDAMDRQQLLFESSTEIPQSGSLVESL